MKKIVTILLGLLLCLACFAGCGDGGGEEQQQPSGGNQGETSGGNQGETSGGNQGETSGGQTGEGSGEQGEPSEQSTWEEDGVFKLLMIGNSYTDDTIEYIWQIANSMGIEAEIGRLTIGGNTLSQHYGYASKNQPAYNFQLNANGTWVSTPDSATGDIVLSNDWDFISLQQGSMQSALPETFGDLDPFLAYLNGLIEGTSTQIVWLSTWAYPNHLASGAMNPNAAFATNFGSDQQKMYKALMDTVQSVIVPRGLPIIPSGTAIQNARTSFLGDTLNRDDVHLSFGLGRYISSLTAVRKLTGRELPANVFKPSTVTPDEQLVAIESAENAVKTPFEVTPSAYTE